MISIIEGNTTQLVSLALDAAVMRQQAIAQNIANANTPGYRRKDVSFESQLAGAMTQDGRLQGVVGASLRGIAPVLTVAPSTSKVALDEEIAHLSENTLHHQVLLKALGKYYALMDSAINEGKR